MSFSSASERSACSVLVCGVLLGGCLPPALAKYRDPTGAKKTETLALDPLTPAPPSDEARPRAEDASGHGPKALFESDAGSQRHGPASPAAHPEAPGIYAINAQTFRIAAKDEDVWDAVLEVLLRHYTLTIVDRYAGIITTEWDSFMRGKVAYRNRISLRVRRSGRTTVDLTLRNNVERLRGLAEGGGAFGGVWLSSEDPGQEVRRIVQNLAILLEMPPPVFAPDSLSARVPTAASGKQR
jgi:hypothetical protein